MLFKRINELQSIIKNLNGFSENIILAANLISKSFNNNNKLLLCGNGGSAAEAQHIAAEYVSSLRHEFKRKSLPAIALTTDTSFLTATGNDYGFDSIYERQIESLGHEGDVLIAISTSGNSKNVVRAIEIARIKGMKIIGLTGENGGKIKDMVDILFNVPSNETMRIQECHLFIEHTICELVEDILFGETK